MDQLRKYRRSPINIISIRYEKESIRINVAQAARIREADIEGEIKNQPSYYAFLFMLHKRLLTKFELLKLKRKSLFSRLYAEAKDRTGKNGRPLSETAVKAWVEGRKQYLQASEKCIRARDEADQLQAAVRAFEQRKDLLQTLSSNIRKERI